MHRADGKDVVLEGRCGTVGLPRTGGEGAWTQWLLESARWSGELTSRIGSGTCSGGARELRRTADVRCRCEGLQDDHRGAAVPTEEHRWLRGLRIVLFYCRGIQGRAWGLEELASGGEEEPVVCVAEEAIAIARLAFGAVAERGSLSPTCSCSLPPRLHHSLDSRSALKLQVIYAKVNKRSAANHETDIRNRIS
jgi:hypothetical protein